MPASAAMRVTKNTSLLMAGTLVRMAVSFALVVLAARFLGVEGFGKYALATHYFELFLSLSSTALGILLTRELANQTGRESPYLTSAAVSSVGMTLIGCCVLFVLTLPLGYAADTRTVIMLASAAMFPAALATVLEAAYLAQERAQYVGAGIAVECLARFALSMAALASGYGLVGLVAALVAARFVQLCFYGMFLRQIVPNLQWDFDRQVLSKLLRDWRVFAAENWLATIYTSLDVIILSVLGGATAVGVYVAAGKLVRLGAVVATSYTRAIFPYLSRLHGESEQAFHRVRQDSLKYMFALALPMIAVTTVLADRVIHLLFSAEYGQAVPVVRVLIWMVLLEFLNPFLSHTLFARGEQIKSLRVAAVATVTQIVLSLLLVPQWESIGAAWATLLSATTACVFYCWFALGRSDVVETLVVAGRVLLAAAGLALVLFFWQSTQLVPLLAGGAVVYLGLLYLLRVVTSRELMLLQSWR